MIYSFERCVLNPSESLNSDQRPIEIHSRHRNGGIIEKISDCFLKATAMWRNFQLLVLAIVFLNSALGRVSLSFQKETTHSIYGKGELPNDIRLKPVKDLNGYFPFSPPKTLSEWENRAAKLKFQVKVALGLSPEPDRTPLNPRIHGRIDMGDYTIEKVFFESMPGFYVTGNLFRPKKSNGKMPGVLCPHGHWANGRFYDAGEAAAKVQVEQGAESDLEAARNPIQARCVHLARMGCVVFQYDMIGYADCIQISYDLAHRFAKQRPEYNGKNWGLFSPDAEMNLQSIMGLQTWNSIRSLDFLETLEDVDANRLAVTGASGGGTQTILLAAVDPRIKVAFPAVMVSTAMQGGCTCENCSLLRVTTGNVELAALFAPHPQGVTAANDWTKEMKTKGFPDLTKVYELFGKVDDVMLLSRTEFGHNYNKVSRTSMYGWFKKYLGLKGSTVERPYKRLTSTELTVWNEEFPRPESDPDFERRLLANWKKDSDRKLAEQAGLRKYFSAIFQQDIPRVENVSFESTSKHDRGGYWLIKGKLRNSKYSQELPVVFVHPKKWNEKVVILTNDSGKDALFRGEKLSKNVSDLVDQGFSVVGVDLLFQGDFLADGPLNKTRRVENPREAAAYTFGYNHSLFSHRVHDLMNLVVLVANHERKPKSISLIGLGDTGSIVAGAMTMVGDRVKDIYISRDSLSALDVNDIHAPFFMPGSMKYGGVVGMLRDSKRNVVVFGSSKSDVSKKQLNELMNQKSRLTTIQEKSFPLIID